LTIYIATSDSRSKDIAQFWPELKLLISSATMDAEKFSKYFDKVPIFFGEPIVTPGFLPAT
jgi:hypothetical protein